MWKRRELKKRARQLLKENYWSVVLTGIILSLIGNSGILSAGERSSGNFEDLVETLGMEDLGAAIVAALGIVGIALLINFVVKVLILNPLEVGCKKVFIQCEYGTAEIKSIWSTLNKSDRNHIGWVMFLRTLFITLWTMLLIIPGIVKQYEYMMVPFLLAEDPQIDRKEAFRKSREMMKGNKWAAFVLDLSFIGWSLLGIITLGLLNVFFTGPYQYLTQAQLYFRLKEQYTGEELSI